MNSLEQLKVLCVEDEPFAREELVYFLKKRVSKVFGAVDGKDGVQQYEIHRPDVIVADLLMPVMDGMEMIRQIREKDNSVHVIIATSVNAVDTVIEAVDLGIDGYIVKPMDFTELELKLQKIGDSILTERGQINGPLNTLENKRQIEDTIKKGVVKQVKEFTGKGPREVIVQLIGEEIKITVLGGLTVMEEHLIADNKNHEMVRHQRAVAYEKMAGKLEHLVGTAIAGNVAFKSVEVNLKKNMDQVVLCID